VILFDELMFPLCAIVWQKFPTISVADWSKWTEHDSLAGSPEHDHILSC